jgi:hypothetical protein
MKPMSTQADAFDTAPIGVGEPFGIRSPLGQDLKAGDEMFFEYGRHSNAFLFGEYGFVNHFEERDIVEGEFAGEVNVVDIVEEMMAEQGEVGKWIRQVLEQEGYWG